MLLTTQAIPGVFSGTAYNANLVEIEGSVLDLGTFVISGLTVTAGTGLSVNVALGSASIGGRVTVAAPFVLAGLADNTTNHLFVLNTGMGQSNTTGTPPANSTKLGTADTAGGVVTAVHQGRDSGRQQFLQPQSLVHGGLAAGITSAGHPRSVNLNDWAAAAAEGIEVYGVLPPGAVSGMGARVIVTKTANYTLVWGTDEVVLGDATGGAFTLTLPTAVGHSGNGFTIKKKDNTANVVHVATTGGQTIDTAASPHDLTSPQVSIDLLSDGTNWLLV